MKFIQTLLDKMKNSEYMNLIQQNQDDFAYLLYNNTTNETVGYHNVFNNFYSASIWKPIICLIFFLKFKNKRGMLNLLDKSLN